MNGLELIGEARPTARKAHRCSLCTGPIEPGEQYRRSTYVYDRSAYHRSAYDWRTCSDCDGDDITTLVWAWTDDDDGVTPEAAHEWATETARHPGDPIEMIAARNFLERAGRADR